ncbi:MAG: hypothetical protein BGO82_15240 [Devosia sp. 67-54]|uniref:MgtC/SapB family protein n=1 Tax=unclassified Devosia TaxID=196773 RepID=UPI0009613D7A|nr:MULTISPECIES: MgtC/SapB family protein [unclassified Devosia]MBN9303724.1 MgtC/SapB family protein [Devosia sp.]OJX17599.1 MAG: hypothetical protein BGO82_15240 [Devosia sp. 67-54]
MPLSPTASDLALRIVLTLVAAGVIGFERGAHGKAAGLRTTLLVALAACLAMIQVNLLLPVGGKTPSSFGVMDLMRLPLGILTGVGFIGAGSILKRGAMVIGVTTAATLWFVTVLGLLFGGGQIALGAAGTVIGVMVIQGLRAAERLVARDRRASLTVRSDSHVVEGGELEAMVAAPFRVTRLTYARSSDGSEERSFHLLFRPHPGEPRIPALVRTMAQRPGVLSVRWDGGETADE